MEGQDNRRFRGQHFFVFLSEAESDYATSDPAFLRQVCLAMGYPPLPLELAESLNEGEGDVEGAWVLFKSSNLKTSSRGIGCQAVPRASYVRLDCLI